MGDAQNREVRQKKWEVYTHQWAIPGLNDDDFARVTGTLNHRGLGMQKATDNPFRSILREET